MKLALCALDGTSATLSNNAGELLLIKQTHLAIEIRVTFDVPNDPM